MLEQGVFDGALTPRSKAARLGEASAAADRARLHDREAARDALTVQAETGALDAEALAEAAGAAGLSDGEAARLRAAAEAARRESVARAAAVDRIDSLSGPLDPEDARDRADVDAYWHAVAPVFASDDPAAARQAELRFVRRTGVLPAVLARQYQGMLLSGDAALAVAGARALATLEKDNPRLLTDIPIERRLLARGVAEFADLLLPPDRALELGREKATDLLRLASAEGDDGIEEEEEESLGSDDEEFLNTTPNDDPFERIKRGAEEVNERLREEVRRKVRAGESVRFDPRSGVQPLTDMDKLRRGAEPTLRRGPEFQSSRERFGPLGRSNLGDVGIGDFIPGVDVGLALDDLRALEARERAGLDVEAGEKIGAAMGVPLAILGLKGLSNFGGELLDRVARRLGKDPTPSVLDKLAKEGIPVNENINAGRQAVRKALAEKTSIPAAMYRPDVGEITIGFGDRGTRAHNFADGSGLDHIIARRELQGQDGETLVKDDLPEVLAKGRLSKIKTIHGERRVEIAHRGHIAVLSLFRDGNRETWVLTAFKNRKVKGKRGRTRLGPRQRPKQNK